MLTRKAYSDIITFTRASSGGRFNAQGVYEMVPANTPRIDYDPVTGECRGLLIEEQRTNLWAQGNTAGGHSGCTRTNTGVPSSYSPHTWQRATITTAMVGHHIEFYNGALTVGTTYTFSLDIRRGNFDTIALWNSVNSILTTIDLSSGAAGTPANCTVLPLGNGAYRLSWRGTATATSQGFRVYFNAGGGSWTGNGTDYFDYANPQLEVGSFPTSYTPTSGSQVTRAADVASINTLSPWWNSVEGSLYLEHLQYDTSVQIKHSATFSDGTVNNRLAIRTTGVSHNHKVVSGGVNKADYTSGGLLTGQTNRCAFSISASGMSASVNGNTVFFVAGVDGVPIATKLNIGTDHGGVSAWNGHIKRIKYFPKRLDNATLQQITS